MEKNTKIIIGLGVLVVGGLATFLVLRNRNKKDEIKIDEGGALVPDASKGTPLKMGYLQKGYVHIEGGDRAKATEMGLKKGSQVEIEGTNFDGIYAVTYVWKDSNGNVGAFKTDPASVGADAPTGRTYQGKANIYIK